MTRGIGGSTIEAELARFRSRRADVPGIGDQERRHRVARLQAGMRAQGVQAVYLDASTSTFYFTGLPLHGSERLHGVVVPAQGELVYVTPAFEAEKLQTVIRLPGRICCWHEHEDPAALVVDTVRSLGHERGTIALDPATPFFTFDRFRRAGNAFEFITAGSLIAECRAVKSPQEIALIKHAMGLTLEVHKAAARILRPGITTTEVSDFIGRAHTALGFDLPSSFCIVLFGEPTAYPHGVPNPQTLRDGDTVLIDIGAPMHGYQSDLTRTYTNSHGSVPMSPIAHSD